MRSRRSRRSRRCMVLILVVVALAALLAATGAAGALTVTVPARAVSSIDATVTLSSTDPTGTVRLLVDGATARVGLVATQGGQISFKGVGVPEGDRRISALVTDGGRSVTATAVVVSVWGPPEAPTLIRPDGNLCAGVAEPIARAGRSTTSLMVLVNGAPWQTVSCWPGQTVYFARVGLVPGWNSISVIASNPFGQQSRIDRWFMRFDYPASTCIVIDKSDFRLYWIQNDTFVKSYPIAIGKPSTPTPATMWIVGLKEYMPPAGVYGPRRLKLARWYGSGYRMTGYGIHGTNEPWVIGTMASHGCIRLTNDQILDLWPRVPLGTVVQTRQ